MTSNLWTVIPAAGQSKRFKDAGYSVIKPLLKLKDPDNSVDLMINFVIDTAPEPRYVIVALPSEVDTRSESFKVCEIEKTTGQADTILQVIKTLPPEDQVLVLDCDMLLELKDINLLVELISVYDCTIAVTETFDPNSSRVDKVPFPTRFVEKEPISQYGIVGARAFNSIGKLIDALKRTVYDCNLIGTEPYLSMALNHYFGTKYAHIITDFVDLGTPDRIKESGWSIV